MKQELYENPTRAAQSAFDLMMAGHPVVNHVAECMSGKSTVMIALDRLWHAQFGHDVQIVHICNVSIGSAIDDLKSKFVRVGEKEPIIYSMYDLHLNIDRIVNELLSRPGKKLIHLDESHWALANNGSVARLLRRLGFDYRAEKVHGDIYVNALSATSFPSAHTKHPHLWIEPGHNHISWASLGERFIDVQEADQCAIRRLVEEHVLCERIALRPGVCFFRLPPKSKKNEQRRIRQLMIDEMKRHYGPEGGKWSHRLYTGDGSEQSIKSLGELLKRPGCNETHVAFVVNAGNASQTFDKRHIMSMWEGPWRSEHRNSQKHDTYTQHIGRAQGYNTDSDPSYGFSIHGSKALHGIMNDYYNNCRSGVFDSLGGTYTTYSIPKHTKTHLLTKPVLRRVTLADSEPEGYALSSTQGARAKKNEYCLYERAERFLATGEASADGRGIASTTTCIVFDGPGKFTDLTQLHRFVSDVESGKYNVEDMSDALAHAHELTGDSETHRWMLTWSKTTIDKDPSSALTKNCMLY